MKKFISCTLILALCLSLMAGCGSQNETAASTEVVAEAAESNLPAAKEYLYTMYKDMPEATPADYTVVGTLVIGTETFQIDWSANTDTINFVRGDDKMVTVDVDEKNPEEVSYKLTGAIKAEDGSEMSVVFEHRVPAAIIIADASYEEIVEAAYTLEDGLAMQEPQTLFGVITSIDTEYSEKYDNITVTIQIGDLADKKIQCFRLSGEGVKDLKVGDEITVEGILKNYKGTIEFDKGCTLVGMGEKKDQSAILEGAYKLEDGLSMNEPVTLTGVIKTIDTEYSEKYDNITVTIICDGIEDKPIQCFRLSGEGVKDLAVGNTITVTGTLKNYKGTIEFDKGCTLDAVQ